MAVIETKNLSKQFGDFTAVDQVSIQFKSGEIHAICGENGAGKSTLMNMLYGLLQPSSGELLINGEKVRFQSPRDAVSKGIGMVHQHFKLVPSLTVYENVLLGHEICHNYLIDDNVEAQTVQDTIDRFDFDLDAKSIVGQLSVGEQQRVEIIKMLHQDVDVLIMDEPTAVLTPEQIDELLKQLIALKKQGKTIILITHKLDEVKKCADRVTVIRRGKWIATVNNSDVSKEDISTLMVGRSVREIKNDKDHECCGKVGLKLEDICFKIPSGKDVLDHVNIEVKYGEIVGIAGIEGNGQSELVNILTGIIKQTSGKFIYEGKEVIDSSPLKLREMGFALVPEDRYKEGLSKEMSVWENMIAGRYKEGYSSSKGILNKGAIRQKTMKLVKEYDIRNCNDITIKVGNLSGGNAQKIIMARELSCNPKVTVMSQPTRGVDIGAIEFIHSKILELKEANKAVLIVSSDLNEILNLSDRIYVMHKGKIAGVRKKAETSKEDLGRLMVGIDSMRSQDEQELSRDAYR